MPLMAIQISATYKYHLCVSHQIEEGEQFTRYGCYFNGYCFLNVLNLAIVALNIILNIVI